MFQYYLFISFFIKKQNKIEKNIKWMKMIINYFLKLGQLFILFFKIRGSNL